MSRCLVGAVTFISLCMQNVRGWGMSRNLKSGGTTANIDAAARGVCALQSSSSFNQILYIYITEAKL